MKKIIIRTQKDLDNLPLKFDELTEIEIRSNDVINVSDSHKRESSIVYARNSSTVTAYDSSIVYARNSSTVYARLRLEIRRRE